MNIGRPLFQFLVLTLTLLSAGCQSQLPRPATATPLPETPTPVIALTEITRAVALRVRGVEKTVAGQSARVRVAFEPVIYRVSRRSDGSIHSSTQTIWENHTIAEMQVCVLLDRPCEPNDQWTPFAPTLDLPITVDWLGPREVWIVAQFRDRAGALVPAIGDAYIAEPRAQVSVHIVGVIDEATPLALQPPPVQTEASATRTAAPPVTGAVKIKGSPCCVGGKVGSTLEIQVNFQAASPYAPVTEMRTTNHCPRDDEPMAGTWEKFAPTKTYTTTAALNWVGWYIAAQYRDAQGNLSPVYCDDISVEGTP